MRILTRLNLKLRGESKERKTEHESNLCQLPPRSEAPCVKQSQQRPAKTNLIRSKLPVDNANLGRCQTPQWVVWEIFPWKWNVSEKMVNPTNGLISEFQVTSVSRSHFIVFCPLLLHYYYYYIIYIYIKGIFSNIRESINAAHFIIIDRTNAQIESILSIRGYCLLIQVQYRNDK